VGTICTSQETAYAGASQIATNRENRETGACTKAAPHPSENLLPRLTGSGNLSAATPPNHGPKRGPVAKRRFQKGCFQLNDGKAYSFYYEDFQQSDGALGTRKVRHLIGPVGPSGISERAARREHDRIMQEVNRKRGSVPPAVKGKTFADAVAAWRTAVAPNLSPSTVRQRESYLRQHILPRFKDSAPHSLDISAVQQFATDLRKKLSRKTVINVLGTIFVILDYAGRTGTLVSKVSFSDIKLGSDTAETTAPFFTRNQAARIIAAAKEPYKTMFALAWTTGLRAGELLALTKHDLDFSRQTIRVNKSSDDNTRQIRQPKTKNSTAILPMPSALEAMLRNYLAHHWRPNPSGLLFPSRKGVHPRWRDNCVKYGLHPILKRLGIPYENVGLHAFRHGLATELAESAVPLPVLQQQMRHADVRTTLRVYAHAIPSSQREVMERLGSSISTVVPIGTE
jgi:integrase